MPAKGGGGLHGQAGAHRLGQHGLLVGLVLLLEQLHAGHGDHAGVHALGLEQLAGLHAEGDLGAGSEQDDVGLGLVAVHQHIAALHGLLAAAGQQGQGLAGKGQAAGALAADGHGIGGRGLAAICGTEQGRVGHGAHGGQLLDGLVGGAVLAHADGVVGQHVEHGQLHERRKPDAVLEVIGEDQEGGAIGVEAAMDLHAVADGRHGLLAHAKVQVGALGGLGGEVAAALDIAHVGAGKVRRAAHQPLVAGGQAGQALAGGVAGGVVLFKGEEVLVLGEVRGLALEPVHVLGVQLRIGFLIALHQLVPHPMGQPAFFHAGGGKVVDLLLHRKALFGVQAQVLLQRLDGLRAQGRAMGGGGALLGAEGADLGVDEEEGRALVVGLGRFHGPVDGVHIVAVLHLQHLPAIGAVAGGGVLAQGDVGVALDGDLVAVIEHDELGQAQRARQGAGLGGDALHHAAVAHQAVGVMVHHGEAVAVEHGGQVLLGHGHAHGVGDALAQGAGGGLHHGRVAVLGMAGGLGAPLAELLEILHGQAIAEEVVDAVEQHGRMARAEHEAVAVVPGGVGRIVAHLAAEEGIHRRRGPQGRARMAGLGLFNGVGGQGADRVDQLLFHGLDHGKTSYALIDGCFPHKSDGSSPLAGPGRSRGRGPARPRRPAPARAGPPTGAGRPAHRPPG